MFGAALRPLLRPTSNLLRTGGQLSRSTCSALRYSSVRFASTRYTTDHEWVAFDSSSNIGTVGITDYAQKALGDVVFVELPSVGTEVGHGDPIGAVESVKAASDIYAPVTGVVEEINETLGDQPNLLNKSPEEKGWLCKVKLSDASEFESLLSESAYKAHCEGDEDDH